MSATTADGMQNSRSSSTPLLRGLSGAQALCQSDSNRSSSLSCLDTDTLVDNLTDDRVLLTLVSLGSVQQLLLALVIQQHGRLIMDRESSPDTSALSPITATLSSPELSNVLDKRFHQVDLTVCPRSTSPPSVSRIIIVPLKLDFTIVDD